MATVTRRPMIAEVLSSLEDIAPLPDMLKTIQAKVGTPPKMENADLRDENRQSAPVRSFDEIEIDSVQIYARRAADNARAMAPHKPRQPHANLDEQADYNPAEMELADSTPNFDDDIDEEFSGGADALYRPEDFGAVTDHDGSSDTADEFRKQMHTVSTLASQLQERVNELPEAIRDFIQNDMRGRFIAVSSV